MTRSEAKTGEEDQEGAEGAWGIARVMASRWQSLPATSLPCQKWEDESWPPSQVSKGDSTLRSDGPLGLRFESTKEPVEVIVSDSAEMPTPIRTLSETVLITDLLIFRGLLLLRPCMFVFD